MSKIRLEDATISFEEKWLSVDDLGKKIQDKISAGDMKFADIAAALEELQAAIEKSQTIDVTLVITKAEYKSLTSIGGKTDSDCVRKAIMHYIGNSSEAEPTEVSLEPPEEDLMLEEDPNKQLEKQEENPNEQLEKQEENPNEQLEKQEENPNEQLEKQEEDDDKKKPRFVDHFLG
jgi:hypothetical protein